MLSTELCPGHSVHPQTIGKDFWRKRCLKWVLKDEMRWWSRGDSGPRRGKSMCRGTEALPLQMHWKYACDSRHVHSSLWASFYHLQHEACSTCLCSDPLTLNSISNDRTVHWKNHAFEVYSMTWINKTAFTLGSLFCETTKKLLHIHRKLRLEGNSLSGLSAYSWMQRLWVTQSFSKVFVYLYFIQ